MLDWLTTPIEFMNIHAALLWLIFIEVVFFSD